MMPIAIILLLILLIAQIGFWDSVGAIVGVAFSVIFALLLLAAIGFLAIRYWLAKSSR